MRSFYITALLTVLCLAARVSVSAQGQQGSGSPYSAYGFGDLYSGTQVTQSLMGVSGIGLADFFSVGSSNPASYTGLVRPVFEAGGVSRFVRYDLDGVTSKGHRTDLLGLTLGVPFARGKWGFAFGLNPFSDVGYKINNYDTLAAGGQVRYQYSGSGGLSKAFIGLARTIWQSNDTLEQGKKLSFGANLNYLFGTVEEDRKAYYPPNGGYYNSSVSSKLIVRSPTVNLGFQFSGDLMHKEKSAISLAERRTRLLAKDRRLEEAWVNAGKDQKKYKHVKIHNRPAEALRYRIGVASELPVDLAAWHTGLGTTFVSGSGGDFTVDTAYSTDGTRGKVSLPGSYGIGVSAYNSRWTGTVEYRLRDWSAFKVNVDGYANRGRSGTQAIYGLGGSFLPTLDPNGSFFLRNTYRLGLRYANDYLVINDKQLREMAVSGGLAIPLGLITRSRINVGAEYGQRGAAGNTLLQERFVNIYLGVTITPEGWDQWFRKRRID